MCVCIAGLVACALARFALDCSEAYSLAPIMSGSQLLGTPSSRGYAGSGSSAASSREGSAGQGLRAAMMASAASEASAAASTGRGRAPADGRFGSEGQSDSWKSQKKGVVKMFDTKFRSSSPARIKKYTSNFEELPEVVACDPDTYDDFAWWSANEYKIVSGEYKGGRLSCDTVLNYLSILVNSTCARFSVSNDTAVK